MRWMMTALALLALTLTGEVLAHSGGLDRNGCHTDSSTGTRHCHNGGGEGDDEDDTGLCEQDASAEADGSGPDVMGAWSRGGLGALAAAFVVLGLVAVRGRRS